LAWKIETQPLVGKYVKSIVITGGTGFIGASLAEHLSGLGYSPVLIARTRPATPSKYEFIPWDAQHLGAWAEALEGALAVVNLAGKTVDCVKTPDNRDLILRSRVDSTKIIGQAMGIAKNPPPVWIQMSTAHIYGDPPSQTCTERSSTGYGLAPFVGKAWERAMLENIPENIREVRLRTSFVLGRNGGALKTLKRIALLGLGGKVGTGRQGISWIHEYDLNEMVRQSIVNDKFRGVYIASSPNPVSNKVFMKELRKKLGVAIGLPVPKWMVSIGARLALKTDPELALYGRYVKSERLENEGFSFQFPELSGALEDLLR
jgi:uncharacterized protein (TIGR01777 family)